MPEKVKFEEIELEYELPALERQVTQELISQFGCGSLDFNPIHIDPVWAKKVNLFGKPFITVFILSSGQFESLK